MGELLGLAGRAAQPVACRGASWAALLPAPAFQARLAALPTPAIRSSSARHPAEEAGEIRQIDQREQAGPPPRTACTWVNSASNPSTATISNCSFCDLCARRSGKVCNRRKNEPDTPGPRAISSESRRHHEIVGLARRHDEGRQMVRCRRAYFSSHARPPRLRQPPTIQESRIREDPRKSIRYS